MAERTEAVLQSQFKAVKRLFQGHSEAVMAVAEALIERDELVAEEIKQLIDEADAKRVTRIVMADFEPLLGNGNGHKNGKNGNGYALIAGPDNGSDSPIDDIPQISPPATPPASGEMGNTSSFEASSDDEGTTFMGG